MSSKSCSRRADLAAAALAIFIAGLSPHAVGSEPPSEPESEPTSEPASETPAQPTGFLDSPEAMAHFERGQRHYRAKAFAAAATELEQAYAIEPHPTLLYAWAQAERQRGDCDRARELYRQFLAADPEAKARVAAEQGISKCYANEIKALPPGPALPVSKPAPPEPKPKPVPAPVMTDDRSRKLTVAGIATLATGGALAVAGLTTGLVFLIEGQSFEERLTNIVAEQEANDCVAFELSGPCPALEQDAQKMRDKGRRANTIGLVTLAGIGGAGLVGVAVGGALLGVGLRDRKRAHAARRIGISLVPLGVSVGGRF